MFDGNRIGVNFGSGVQVHVISGQIAAAQSRHGEPVALFKVDFVDAGSGWPSGLHHVSRIQPHKVQSNETDGRIRFGDVELASASEGSRAWKLRVLDEGAVAVDGGSALGERDAATRAETGRAIPEAEAALILTFGIGQANSFFSSDFASFIFEGHHVKKAKKSFGSLRQGQVDKGQEKKFEEHFVV